MSGRTFIHINGTRYEASGDSLLSHVSQVRNIDGVIHQTNLTPGQKTIRSVAGHHSPRTPEKAKTLSRSAVKKPVRWSDVRPAVGHQKIIVGRPSHDIASSVTRSEAIQRFSPKLTADLKPVTAPLQGTDYHNQETYTPKKRSDSLIDKHIERATAHLSTARPVVKKRRLKARLANMSSLRRKIVTVGAGLTAFLLIGGFALYNNMPGLSLQIASRRAGFSALLPEYTPSGYHLRSPVAYSSSRVILNFDSNTSDNNYQIEQTPSGWSTDTLRDQVSSTSGSQYQTFQVKGLTIFFTNNNSATWVDRGILFSLKGDSGLSGDQIANIAASM